MLGTDKVDARENLRHADACLHQRTAWEMSFRTDLSHKHKRVGEAVILTVSCAHCGGMWEMHPLLDLKNLRMLGTHITRLGAEPC